MERGTVNEGDRVRFREWEDLKEEFGDGMSGNTEYIKTPGLVVIDYMKPNCGKTFTVSSVRIGSEDGYDQITPSDPAIRGLISNYMVEPEIPPLKPVSDGGISEFLFGKGDDI